MEANRSRMHWTYEEFARLPTSGSIRYEVIDGELAVTPPPTPAHQQVVANLLAALHPFVNEHALGRLLPGPIDVLFGEGDYLEPDLVFVQGDRAHLVSRRGIEGAPDLVVEVLSPSTAHRDRGIKLKRYRHFAVPEYWIVDFGGRCLEVWRLGDGADAPEVIGAGERLLWTPVEGDPALDIAVDEVFAGA